MKFLKWSHPCMTAVLDFFYPRYCPCCSVRLSSAENGVCPFCMIRMARYCEATVQARDRLDAIYLLSGLDSLFLYQKTGLIRKAIHDFKYNGNKSLGSMLGRMGARTFRWSRDGYDCIVAIPIDPVRKMKRGYSQTDVLAQAVSRETGIPFLPDALCRKAFSHSQTAVTAMEREENVSKAFSVRRPETLKGKRILLVDDILTTGSTLTAAGILLEACGVQSIRIFTLAVTE